MANEQDDLPPVAEPLSRAKEALGKFATFWRTRAAIIGGKPLYDWSPDQIKEAGYFGPWTFNAVETAFVGGIASVVVNFFRALLRTTETPAEPTFLTPTDPALASLLERTNQWFEPFFIPILTTSVVFLAAWGSLRFRDSNPNSRSRARRAYLYLDATYGLFSQLFLALALSIVSVLDDATSSRFLSAAPAVAIAGIISILVAFVYQYYINMRKIPKTLFVLNGYLPRYVNFWNKKLPNDPPMSRWTLSIYLGGWPLIFLASLTLSTLSLLTAHMISWLQGLVR